MNSLSWLIYLADVFNNFGQLFGWTGLLIMIGGIGVYACSLAFKKDSLVLLYGHDYRDETSDRYKQAIEDKKYAAKTAGSLSFWGRFMIITALVVWVLGAATPKKETMYAIAASEMGEELLKTPTAAKATKALESWLDKQITEQTKPAPAN